MSRWAKVSFEWLGGGLTGATAEEVKQALQDVAGDLQSKSRDEAPVETGDLRGNCTIDDSGLDSGSISVGYSLPYAMKQHEELNYNHPKGGKAKYLEDPYNANKDKYVETIGASVEVAITKISFAK